MLFLLYKTKQFFKVVEFQFEKFYFPQNGDKTCPQIALKSVWSIARWCPGSARRISALTFAAIEQRIRYVNFLLFVCAFVYDLYMYVYLWLCAFWISPLLAIRRKRFFLFISLFLLQIVSEFFQRFLACNWFFPLPLFPFLFALLLLHSLKDFLSPSLFLPATFLLVLLPHCSNVFCIFYGTCNANTTTITTTTSNNKFVYMPERDGVARTSNNEKRGKTFISLSFGCHIFLL